MPACFDPDASALKSHARPLLGILADADNLLSIQGDYGFPQMLIAPLQQIGHQGAADVVGRDVGSSRAVQNHQWAVVDYEDTLENISCPSVSLLKKTPESCSRNFLLWMREPVNRPFWVGS